MCPLRIVALRCVAPAAPSPQDRCTYMIMTSGAPPEPTTTGYAPNESRRAAALPTRVEEPFARQYVQLSSKSDLAAPFPKRQRRRPWLTLFRLSQAATTGQQRPVGLLPPTTDTQVCANLSRICAISSGRSAIQKFSASARLDRHEPHRRHLPSLLDHPSTALGTRGMVQPTRRSFPRDPSALRLGDLTALRPIPNLTNAHASRK